MTIVRSKEYCHDYVGVYFQNAKSKEYCYDDVGVYFKNANVDGMMMVSVTLLRASHTIGDF